MSGLSIISANDFVDNPRKYLAEASRGGVRLLIVDNNRYLELSPINPEVERDLTLAGLLKPLPTSEPSDSN